MMPGSFWFAMIQCVKPEFDVPGGAERPRFEGVVLEIKEDKMHAIPSSIHEGMKVVDRSMHEIGTVETFRATDDDPEGAGGQGAVGVSPALEEDRNSLAAVLADVFAPDDELPREMQEKAMREGFVRVDGRGLFSADRYIFPEHIDRVEGDRLVLNVEKDALLRA